MPNYKSQFRQFNLAVARLRWVVGLLAILPMASPASGDILNDIKKACDQIGMMSGAIVASGAPAAFGVPAQIAALNQLQSALEAALQAAKRELDTNLDIANKEVERTQSELARLDVQGAQEALRIIDRDAEADKKLVREQEMEIRGKRQALAEEWLALQGQLAQKQNEIKTEQAVGWLYRDNKKIERLAGEASAIEEKIQAKSAGMKELDEEVRLKQQFIAEIDANKEAKKAPYRERIAEGKEKEKRLQSAQGKVRSFTMAKAEVQMASYPAQACIENKINALKGKPADNQQGNASGGEEGGSPIDYAAVGKAVDEHNGSGGNPADSQGVKKPVGPQGEGYQGSGGGIGMIGKIPPVAWGSGMVPPPTPQGSDVRGPGTDWQGLAPKGGQTGGGSGGGALPGPQVTSKPPAQLPPAAPTPKPPQWVVWEAGFSIGVHVSTEEEFQDTRPVKYTGGGPEPTVVKRNKLGGPFASQQAACEWIRPKLTNVRVRPVGIGLVGTFSGTEYYIGSMGCS